MSLLSILGSVATHVLPHILAAFGNPSDEALGPLAPQASAAASGVSALCDVVTGKVGSTKIEDDVNKLAVMDKGAFIAQCQAALAAAVPKVKGLAALSDAALNERIASHPNSDALHHCMVAASPAALLSTPDQAPLFQEAARMRKSGVAFLNALLNDVKCTDHTGLPIPLEATLTPTVGSGVGRDDGWSYGMRSNPTPDDVTASTAAYARLVVGASVTFTPQQVTRNGATKLKMGNFGSVDQSAFAVIDSTGVSTTYNLPFGYAPFDLAALPGDEGRAVLNIKIGGDFTYTLGGTATNVAQDYQDTAPLTGQVVVFETGEARGPALTGTIIGMFPFAGDITCGPPVPIINVVEGGWGGITVRESTFTVTADASARVYVMYIADPNTLFNAGGSWYDSGDGAVDFLTPLFGVNRCEMLYQLIQTTDNGEISYILETPDGKVWQTLNGAIADIPATQRIQDLTAVAYSRREGRTIGLQSNMTAMFYILSVAPNPTTWAWVVDNCGKTNVATPSTSSGTSTLRIPDDALEFACAVPPPAFSDRRDYFETVRNVLAAAAPLP